MSISIQNDPNADHLKTYLPPFKGTWKTLPEHLIPDDAVQESMNVSLLGGKLRSRCGLEMYNSATFDAPISGSFMFVGVSNIKYPVASSKSKVYKYLGSWQEIPVFGTTLVGLDTSQVRMTSIQQGSIVYLIYTNGVQPLLVSEELVSLVTIPPYITTPISIIPILKDLCTSFDRIVGIQPPYTVTWCDVVNSNYLGFTNWPSLNQAILSQTEDSLVAIRNLGTLGIAVYKEGNIFLGIAQQGPNSQAFRFEHRGEYEGPAGVQSIVNVNGVHVYMTSTGRVGYFDGTQHDWICDGIWPFLQDDLDTVYASKIHGSYNYRTSELYFWYPKLGDNGILRGMLIINWPYKLAGIQSYSYFLGYSSFEITNSLTVRLFNATTSPLAFSKESDIYRTYALKHTHYFDNAVPFQCSFKTGVFKPIVQESTQQRTRDTSDIYRPILELYSTRDSTRKTVQLSAVLSQSLEDTGTSTSPEIIDLTSVQPNEYIGFNETGSFIGIEASWSSDSKFEYKGCDIYGRRTA